MAQLLPFSYLNCPTASAIYTLSLHDALPICLLEIHRILIGRGLLARAADLQPRDPLHEHPRSEEHTSELQSRQYLVCRLLLEKKTVRRSCAPAARLSRVRRRPRRVPAAEVPF